MTHEDKNRIYEEVSNLRHQMYTCAHCSALRNQIIELMNILPLEPLIQMPIAKAETGLDSIVKGGVPV
jgi:hypothetical protein